MNRVTSPDRGPDVGDALSGRPSRDGLKIVPYDQPCRIFCCHRRIIGVPERDDVARRERGPTVVVFALNRAS